MTRQSGIAFLLLGLVWGSTWLAADALADQVPPLQAAAIRFLLSSLCFAPFLFRARVPFARILLPALLLSVTVIVCPLLLLLWARPQLPSATVVVLYAAMPLAVILLTPWFAGQTPPPARAMQASVVALGGMVLATQLSFSLAQAGAAAVVLLAVVMGAAGSLLARRAVRGFSVLSLTACVLAMAGLLLGAASLLWEPHPAIAWHWATWLPLLLLALVGGAPAYAAWFWLLGRWPAYQVATLQWLAPLVALGESAALVRARPNSAIVAGLLITAACLLIVVLTRERDDENVSFLGI